MRQAAKYNIQATEALPQLLALRFVDAEGEALDVSGMSLRGAVLQDGGIVELGCEMTGANTALVSWPRLVAGCGRYDLFLTDKAGKEYPLLRGGVHVVERVTPADGSEVEGSGAVAGGLVVTIPEAVDGAVTICEDCSVEVGALIEEAADAAEAAAGAAKEATAAAGRAANSASESQVYAVQAMNFRDEADGVLKSCVSTAQSAEEAATVATEAAGAAKEATAAAVSQSITDLKAESNQWTGANTFANGIVLHNNSGICWVNPEDEEDLSVRILGGKPEGSSSSTVYFFGTDEPWHFKVDIVVDDGFSLKVDGLEGNIITAKEELRAERTLEAKDLIVSSGGGSFSCAGPASFHGAVTMTNLEVYSDIVAHGSVRAWNAVNAGSVVVDSSVVLGGTTDGDWMRRSGTNEVVFGGVNKRTRLFLPSDGSWGEAVSGAEVLTRDEVEALIDEKIESALSENS